MYKSPLFYINITLVLVIGLIVFSLNASNLNLPPFVQKIANAVGHLVSGSGTSNTLAVFNNSNTLGDSTIFQDSVTGNVGIGNTNPGIYKLNVNGFLKAPTFCLGTDCRATWPGGTSYSAGTNLGLVGNQFNVADSPSFSGNLNVGGNTTLGGKVTGATYGFGGMYTRGTGSQKYCYVPNPFTNACSCPTGFTVKDSGSMNPLNGNLYFCYK